MYLDLNPGNHGAIVDLGSRRLLSINCGTEFSVVGAYAGAYGSQASLNYGSLGASL